MQGVVHTTLNATAGISATKTRTDLTHFFSLFSRENETSIRVPPTVTKYRLG